MEGWEQTTIGATCLVTAGQSPKGEYYNDSGEGYPFYQGKKEFREKYIAPPRKWTTQLTKEAIEGDILMSVRAPVGPINFATEPICIGRGLAGIRAGEQLDREFLYYVLLSMQEQIEGSEGAVFASINKKQIADLPIPLPPLPEQERIVAILDEAFAAIETATAHTEKNLANARELFESQLNSLVVNENETWKTATLSDLCSISHGFPFKGPEFGVSVDPNKPILITPGNFTEHAELSFTKKNTKRFFGVPPKESVFSTGDLVVVMTDLSSKMKILGKPAFIDRSNILHNQRIGKISFCGASLLPNFLYYFLQTNRYLKEIKSTATGTAVMHTAPKRILSISIQFPQKNQQQKIVENLEALRIRCSDIERRGGDKIHHLANLKQSLLQKAFTGELTSDKKAADRTLSEAGL
jgi:type I restriction enzyme, S subunit